jgi:2'-5' RNA ligase
MTGVGEGGRVQATVLLPEPAASVVQAIREVHDAEMARRIAPHVTLVHDAPDDALLAKRLASVATRVTPFLIVLGPPTAWDDDPDNGIHLPVLDPDAGIDRVRRALERAPDRQLENMTFTPHVTLVHPRTTTSEQRHAAWDALREQALAVDTAIIDRLQLVGETGDGWDVLAEHVLGIFDDRGVRVVLGNELRVPDPDEEGLIPPSDVEVHQTPDLNPLDALLADEPYLTGDDAGLPPRRIA